MTDTTPETEPLTVEMRRGDKFVSVEIEDDYYLRDSTYNLTVMNALANGMAAQDAIWPPLTQDRIRTLALDYAQRLVSGQPMNPDQAMRDYRVSWDEANEIAALAATATVSLTASTA